jgi:alpha-tubulin suppressor-like RCC1 family protein
VQRLRIVALAVLLTFGLLIGAPNSGTTAQAAANSAPKASPSYPIRSARLTISGRLSTKVVRPVALQRKIGSKWHQIGAGKTTKSGAYSFATAIAAPAAQLRVVARKVKVGKRTYRQIVSKVTRLQTVAVSPSAPVAGETFTVAANLGKKGSRPVALQRKIGSRWVQIRSGKTNSSGAFTFSVSIPASSNLRVVAAKTKVKKRTLPKITSKTFRVNTSAQSGSLSAPATGITGQALTATVTFAPARAGRGVQLQQWDGSQWQTVATGTQSSSGAATLAVAPTNAGSFVYRGFTDPYRGAPAVATASTSATITSGTATPTIVTNTVTNAIVGEQFYAVLVAAGGTAPYTWTATGQPTGLSITTDGTLAGTPTAEGPFTTHLTATDANGKTAETNIEIVVAAAVGIGSDALPTALSGDQYDTTLVGTGGTEPYRWTATGLPVGLTLSSDGYLRGTTTSGGDHLVDLTITDAHGKTATKTLTLTVAVPLAITTTALPGALLGSSYSTDLAATGGTAPYSWAAEGLPEGLALSTSGVLTGTPTAAGAYSEVKITVTDQTGQTATVTLSMAVTSVNVTAVAGGDAHTCAISSTGGVSCWGNNGSGQLGNGTTTSSATPVQVSGLTSGVKTVVTGAAISCAITDAGALKCWGSNTFGKLGDGSGVSRLVPTSPTGLSSGVIGVALGGNHSCALTSAGGVKCWGYNNKGQLGTGNTVNAQTPVNVTNLTSGVTAISAGSEHNCALTTAGGIKCWGSNSFGQIGIPTTSTMSASPVSATGATSGISAISAQGSHSCAITTGGALNCWGYNFFGQLGDGTTTSSYLPVAVTGLDSGVSTVSLGSSHTCALTTAGVAQCWGSNTNGQLGDGTTTSSSTPISVTGLGSDTAALGVGSNHSCAVSDSGSLKCWGSDTDGQLGFGGGKYQAAPLEVTGLTNATVIEGATNHSCAITSAGGVECWGYNGFGQLGNSTTVASVSPVAVTGLSSGVVAIDTGESHSCALTTDGGVKCWGYNGFGQLGNGTTVASTTPVDVSGLTSGVIAISTGTSHTCAVTTGGGVKCWGYNNRSQLGNGTTTNSPIPVDVAGLTDVAKITGGSLHTCALTGTGGVKCWGYNDVGQLGNGTTTASPSPVDVTGLTSGVSAITAKSTSTCAVVDGGAKCWGYNGNGQLGNGTTTNSSTPVDVTGLTSGVSAISTGNNHACAITTTGGVKCWGYNNYGQLGDGSFTSASTPVDVQGLASGVTAIATGASHSCAIANGTTSCWGYNNHGQLGHNTIYTPSPTAVRWPSS